VFCWSECCELIIESARYEQYKVTYSLCALSYFAEREYILKCEVGFVLG
jgi:hypothetical protein